MTIEEANVLAEEKYNEVAPLFKQVGGERLEFSEADIEQWKIDYANDLMYQANEKWSQDRAENYPSLLEFVEAYTEKEILADSTKWDAYVVKYNQVRSDFPKPS